MDQIVQHHYFSGKDCPQTMRTEGYWDHFLSLVKVEYQMLQYKKLGFKFELIPINSNYVNKIGRVLKKGNNSPINAYYTIKVIDPNGKEQKNTFITSIPARN